MRRLVRSRLAASPLAALALALALLGGAAPASAGGSLLSFVAAGEPSPFPGEVLATLAPILHDVRCIPAPYSLNVTLDPVPDPFGPDFLSLAEAAAAVERAMASWNDVPTSFIEIRFEGTSDNPGAVAFDTVHEVNFRLPPGFNFTIAASLSTTLFEDTFLAAGTDVDEDGDPDVAAGIATCADVDGDGDWERPAGFYRAGTILDNDVWFNADQWTFVTEFDPAFTTFELEAVAAHELGHSVGLSHGMVTQTSPTDPDGSTMHWTWDWTDALSEADLRTPSADDVGYASYLYPEGSAASGPAALQAGDLAFDAVYGILSGEVTHGVHGVPLPGASVSAVERGTGRVASTNFAGNVLFSLDRSTFAVRALPGFASVLHGRYELPAPAGVYEVWVEAVDAHPMLGASVGLIGSLPEALGLQSFDEEAWHRGLEGAVEVASGRGTPVEVEAGGMVAGLDLVTNRVRHIDNFGRPARFVPFFNQTFSPADAAPGTWFAVRVPVDDVLEAAGGERFAVPSAQIYTRGPTYSTVPRFARALLASGEALPDGTARIDLDPPLAQVTGWVGQDFDFAPVYFADPVGLGERIENGIAAGTVTDLFVAVQLPTEAPFPGPYGLAPQIAFDRFQFPSDVPILGLSYRSTDGGLTFVQDPDFNYIVRLVLSELP